MTKRRPKLGNHTMAQLEAFYRTVPCPKCHAPVGAPCADFRSYDKSLGVHVHLEREDIVLERSK